MKSGFMGNKKVIILEISNIQGEGEVKVAWPSASGRQLPCHGSIRWPSAALLWINKVVVISRVTVPGELVGSKPVRKGRRNQAPIIPEEKISEERSSKK